MSKYEYPNLFLIGMQKSGTESLKNWLNQHPDIWMDAPAELNYFADDVQGCEDYTDFNWYLSQFPKNSKVKYLGDKSARYICSKEAAKRIKYFNPNSKIILILRNPAHTLFSLHRHLRKQGLEPEPDFHKALRKEKKRKKRYGIKYFRHFFYMDVADYYPQVKRFLDVFPSKNVKVIIFEEMKKNPKRIYSDTLKFLKLKNFNPDFKILNVSGALPKNNLHVRILYIIQNLPRPFKRLIKNLSKLEYRNKFRKSGLKKRINKEKIDKETEKRINHALLKSTKKLEKLINKDLSSWYN